MSFGNVKIELFKRFFFILLNIWTFISFPQVYCNSHVPKSGPGHFDQTSVGIRQALNAPKSNKFVNEQIRGGSREIESKYNLFLQHLFRSAVEWKCMHEKKYWPKSPDSSYKTYRRETKILLENHVRFRSQCDSLLFLHFFLVWNCFFFCNHFMKLETKSLPFKYI